MEKGMSTSLGNSEEKKKAFKGKRGKKKFAGNKKIVTCIHTTSGKVKKKQTYN